MDEIENLLLDGEKVLWSGKPDWTKARVREYSVKSKIIHALWIVVIVSITAVIFKFGNQASTDGFIRPVLGVLVIIFLLISVGVIGAFFDFGKSSTVKPLEEYAITDRRLLIVNPTKGSHASYFPGSMYYLETIPNGELQDVAFQYGSDEHRFETLHALNDAEAVERLLHEKFAAKRVTL
jgi:hypothetical protein